MKEDLRKLVFSYGNKFYIMGSNSQGWCWKRHKESLSNHVVNKTRAHKRENHGTWLHELEGHWGVDHNPMNNEQ